MFTPHARAETRRVQDRDLQPNYARIRRNTVAQKCPVNASRRQSHSSSYLVHSRLCKLLESSAGPSRRDTTCIWRADRGKGQSIL